MTPERWARIRELFVSTHELPPDERRKVLEKTCNNDLEILAEVESLLASYDTAEDFFQPLDQSLVATASEVFKDRDRAGTLIGSYRIVRQVAYGGMGEVYEAVRDDGQFQKRVAVKLVRLGLSEKEIIRRFEVERQMLASLQHPNIAQLIDAGTTDDGVPYLMMEFVDGKRIDEYCDDLRFSVAERLRLFRTVCSAVQFAHQNLVVHRDIKPGNILVTGDGTPKLLDFGIAKLMGEEGAGEEMTRTGQGFMTPEYASPEQIRGRKVTTVSDVYSLGVLLYKLLTGQKPYEFKSSLPFDISQTVIDSEPTKPSSKEIRITSKDESHRVQRLLSGDLDNIIMMALRKEPEKRYKSAEQMAEDIRRYLEHVPVHASKDSAGYRLTKFVRRNRVTVIAAVLILLSLFAGLAATLYQVREARLEKARAESINAFLKKMLNFSNPVLLLPRKNSGETTMAEVLDEAAKRIDGGEFDNQMDVKGELEKIIGECYGGLGKYDRAFQYFRRYIDIQKQLYAPDDPRRIEARSFESGIEFHIGELTKAEADYRQVMPLVRSEYEKGRLGATVLAEGLSNFAYLRRTQGDSKEAESLFRETLSLMPNIPDEEKYLLGVTRSTLASTLADQGRFDEALQTAREAVVESQRNGFTGSPHYGFILTVFGGFLNEKGNLQEAEDTLLVAEHIFRKLIGPNSLWLGDNLRNQAISLYQQGKDREALSKVTEALKICITSFGKHYDHYPTALALQGLILTRMGRAVEGERLVREAVKIRTETLPKGHYFTAQAVGALGECFLMQKRFAEAEPLLLDSYNDLKQSQGERNPRALLAEHRLATLYQEWKKPEMAARYQN